MKIRQFLIYGKVQGVGFRFFTLREAKKLGIRGYVCNHLDNSVEVVAKGSDEQLELLAQWLEKGPPTAKVTQVLVQDYLGELQLNDFQIIRKNT